MNIKEVIKKRKKTSNFSPSINNLLFPSVNICYIKQLIILYRKLLNKLPVLFKQFFKQIMIKKFLRCISYNRFDYKSQNISL